MMDEAVAPGDVLLVTLPSHEPKGHEQEGLRPAIVVGKPWGHVRYPVVIVVPLTTQSGIWARENPTRRYETGSIILTTNLPFDRWDSIFGDPIISSAIIDRLVHHCHIFKINGHSYRVKDKLNSTSTGKE